MPAKGLGVFTCYQRLPYVMFIKYEIHFWRLSASLLCCPAGRVVWGVLQGLLAASHHFQSSLIRILQLKPYEKVLDDLGSVGDLLNTNVLISLNIPKITTDELHILSFCRQGGDNVSSSMSVLEIHYRKCSHRIP